MVELTKGQDGELAVGREIVSPGSGGLGGLAYILKLVLQEYQVKTVRWQWLLGRLYVLDRLLEEFPGEFIRGPEPDPDASEELNSSPLPQPHTPKTSSSSSSAATTTTTTTSTTTTTTTTTTSSSSSSSPPPTSSSSCPPSSSSSSQNEFCRIVIVARFATYAVGNAHSRIAKIARRIFFICVKFSAGQDEIVIQLDNLLVTAVDPKLMRPMRKKLSHMVDKIKQTEETANKVWHDSESSQGTSCIGTSATASPNETPLSTPPDSPFPLPTTLDSAANHPLSMTHSYISKDNHQDPPQHSFQNDLQNNQHSSCMDIVNNTGHELRHGLLNDDLQNELQHSSQNDLQYDPHLGPQHPHCSVNASCAKLKNVSVKCSVTLATSDHSGECKVEEISSITACNNNHNNTNTISTNSSCNNNNSSSSSNSNKQFVHNIVCTTKVNNCTDSSGDRSQFMVTMPSTSTPSSSMQHHLDDSNNSSVCHCSSTPLACSSSHSSSNILTEDLSDITVSPTGSNGPSVSFKTEIATPKGSPCGTEDQSKPDSYQYCCKEEVEREEAVALAKALEASAKQEPCPLVPGLTPSDREEVITVRIQPESQTDMHPLESPFNHSSMLSMPNSSSSSSSNNNNNNSSNNNNSPLYLENVHWVRSNLLGTGAFSSCYQARDVKTGTLMAVKQISFCRNTEEEQEKVIQDVTEEIHMIAALNHPNVVRIMGATRQGCHFNMFVEWMPGGSVSNLLAKYGNFSETVVISYTHQVLRGLTYLHENQVLHRDLKGANLLVDSTGQRVRIGDFGAAARLASQTTQAGEFQGQLLGTIAFMAPEVLRGESYGRGCDVWSVGCVMIEMATTKPPWNANDISNHLALIFRIASSVQPPPIPQKMSPGVRDIMLRCLEVKSEDRPPAKELLTHPVFMQHLNR
uniref:Protein kinase domain-containing protein n=2 Tax=Octopus bimaculoides TaxID=37653 RepID=A0A0L8FTJ8_OCTBM